MARVPPLPPGKACPQISEMPSIKSWRNEVAHRTRTCVYTE